MFTVTLFIVGHSFSIVLNSQNWALEAFRAVDEHGCSLRRSSGASRHCVHGFGVTEPGKCGENPRGGGERSAPIYYRSSRSASSMSGVPFLPFRRLLAGQLRFVHGVVITTLCWVLRREVPGDLLQTDCRMQSLQSFKDVGGKDLLAQPGAFGAPQANSVRKSRMQGGKEEAFITFY